MSETVVSDGALSRRSGLWILPEQSQPAQLDAFAAACESLPALGVPGVEGRTAAFGWDWSDFNVGLTLYNHILAPNTPRCLNGNRYQLGCFPAGSAHSGGAHTLFADGHVEFTSEHLAVPVWRSRGSRAGNE